MNSAVRMWGIEAYELDSGESGGIISQNTRRCTCSASLSKPALTFVRKVIVFDYILNNELSVRITLQLFPSFVVI